MAVNSDVTVRFNVISKEFNQEVRNMTTELKGLKTESKLMNAEFEQQATLSGKSGDKLSLMRKELSNMVTQYQKNNDIIDKYKKQLEIVAETHGKNSKEYVTLEGRMAVVVERNKQLADSIGVLSREITTFKLDKLSTDMQNFSNKIKPIGDNMTRYVTLPLLALGGASVKMAGDFESSFANVLKVLDDNTPQEEIERLRTSLLNMSTEMPFTTAQINGTAEALGRMGFRGEQIDQLTETFLKLSVATGIASEEIAMSLGKFMVVMGTSSDEASNLGSSITALGNNFATTEKDIIDMALGMAGMASLAGMSEQDVLALATALSSVGIESEAGGSSMSKMMNILELANEDFKKGEDTLDQYAKVAGVSAEEFSLAWERRPIEAISLFLNGLNGMDEAGASVIGTLDEMGLSEIRLRKALAQATSSVGNFNKAVDISNNAWAENTALNAEAQRKFDTFNAKMQVFINKVGKVAIELGTELLPAIEDIFTAIEPLLWQITDLVKWFSELDDGTQRLILSIVGITIATGPVLKSLSALSSAGSSLVGAFSKIVASKTNVASTIAEVGTASAGATTSAGGLAGALGGLSIATVGVVAGLALLAGAVGYVAWTAWEQSTTSVKEATQLTDGAFASMINRLSELNGLVGSVDDKYKQLNETLGVDSKQSADYLNSIERSTDNIKNTLKAMPNGNILADETKLWNDELALVNEEINKLENKGDVLDLVDQEKLDKLYTYREQVFGNVEAIRLLTETTLQNKGTLESYDYGANLTKDQITRVGELTATYQMVGVEMEKYFTSTQGLSYETLDVLLMTLGEQKLAYETAWQEELELYIGQQQKLVEAGQITQEDANKRVDDYKTKYNEKWAEVQAVETKINEIVQTAGRENRVLTEDEYNKIRLLTHEHGTLMAGAIGTNAQEQQVLQEAYNQAVLSGDTKTKETLRNAMMQQTQVVIDELQSQSDAYQKMVFDGEVLTDEQVADWDRIKEALKTNKDEYDNLKNGGTGKLGELNKETSKARELFEKEVGKMETAVNKLDGTEATVTIRFKAKVDPEVNDLMGRAGMTSDPNSPWVGQSYIEPASASFEGDFAGGEMGIAPAEFVAETGSFSTSPSFIGQNANATLNMGSTVAPSVVNIYGYTHDEVIRTVERTLGSRVRR